MSEIKTISFANVEKFKEYSAIVLNDFTNDEDEKLYNELIKDDYIMKKCANRAKRIKDIKDYVNNLAPEIFHESNKNLNHLYVIDIGPGPGELLELARHHGYGHLGFDAPLDDCEMGDKYIKFSHLMAKRQNINIEYCDFYKKIGNLGLQDSTVVFINSRGSIEQVFRDHLVGVPHKVHKEAKRLAWKIDDDLKDKFRSMFLEFSRVLVTGGTILIHGNGASNVNEYNDLIKDTIENIESLVIEASDKERLHKIRKIN